MRVGKNTFRPILAIQLPKMTLKMTAVSCAGASIIPRVTSSTDISSTRASPTEIYHTNKTVYYSGTGTTRESAIPDPAPWPALLSVGLSDCLILTVLGFGHGRRKNRVSHATVLLLSMILVRCFFSYGALIHTVPKTSYCGTAQNTVIFFVVLELKRLFAFSQWFHGLRAQESTGEQHHRPSFDTIHALCRKHIYHLRTSFIVSSTVDSCRADFGW